MDPHDIPTHQDKQITVDVPADRVPEFYAFYGRFLAAGRRRGRRGGPFGHGPGRGRCGHHGEHHDHAHHEHGHHEHDHDEPAGTPAS